MLAGACTAPAAEESTAASDAGGDPAASSAPESAPDPALAAACTQFWGDPDYADPLSRTVLDRAGSAPDSGPSDPFFYAMTADDIELAFEQTDERTQQAVAGLAEWFRTEPERGQDLDRDGFTTAWAEAAEACAGTSAAAAWALAPGEDGTKPAALVCAQVFDTPSTLTHFANSNVLTSNMFKLVGLSGRAVPGDRMDDVEATEQLLSAQIAAVDDDEVRSALEQVRLPFQDALEGDTWSDGLSEPLGALGSACDAAGYSAPALGELEDETDGDDREDGLV